MRFKGTLNFLLSVKLLHEVSGTEPKIYLKDALYALETKIHLMFEPDENYLTSRHGKIAGHDSKAVKEEIWQ